MKSIVVIICLLVLGVFAQAKQTKYGVNIPENYQDEIDVVYKEVGGWQGRMDVYFDKDKEKPTPLVINIHGGGWNHGEKESQKGYGSFFKKGFAVANVEYRLVDVAPAPAAIEDVRCALLYMIANAKKYNIDTDRIVIMGGSAGGHLALVAGLLQNNHVFDKDCLPVEPVKIAAIIDKYGVADLTGAPKGTWKYKSVRNWLGDRQNSMKFAASVSPIAYVNSLSPPVFIVHGDADPIVPYSQSVTLHEKLVEAGVPTEFITIKGGQHGKFSKEDKSMLSRAIINFLVKQKIID